MRPLPNRIPAILPFRAWINCIWIEIGGTPGGGQLVGRKCAGSSAGWGRVNFPPLAGVVAWLAQSLEGDAVSMIYRFFAVIPIRLRGLARQKPHPLRVCVQKFDDFCLEI